MPAHSTSRAQSMDFRALVALPGHLGVELDPIWGAALLSVAGHQELGTFWERVVQPQVFAVIALVVVASLREVLPGRGVDRGRLERGLDRRLQDAVDRTDQLDELVDRLAERGVVHEPREDRSRAVAILHVRAIGRLGAQLNGGPQPVAGPGGPRPALRLDTMSPSVAVKP